MVCYLATCPLGLNNTTIQQLQQIIYIIYTIIYSKNYKNSFLFILSLPITNQIWIYACRLHFFHGFIITHFFQCFWERGIRSGDSLPPFVGTFSYLRFRLRCHRSAATRCLLLLAWCPAMCPSLFFRPAIPAVAQGPHLLAFFFWTMPEFVSLRRTTGKPKETRWRLKAKRRSSLGMGTHVHTYLLVYVWSCLELFRDRESAEFWLRNLLKI